MKLKRAWPAVLIWVVFLIFITSMVVSYSFFLGLFPSYNALEYSVAFMAISVLIMSVITILLGKACDALRGFDFWEKIPAKVIYGIFTGLIIIGGFWYRLDILSHLTNDVTGKMSLYENARIGAKNITPENDLLSIIYTGILRGILFFTGNIISVPFYFQTICFIIFLICGSFTVYKLLGMPAGLVFTGYVAFMPVFTPLFTGAELSTDPLFMAMFGIEFLLVALFLNGAYRGIYNSNIWAVWYVAVGLAVGYMAYVDAGTIIMILPFLLSCLFLKGRSFKEELIRLLILLAGSLAAFLAMIIQEAGIGMLDVTLYKWGNYYFNNMNTFSTFWSYTDYKIIYLVTVVAMSGVIAGFWKNRKVDIVSPWLLSMLFIFATVPFMGATRMNTQVFVTAYYAFILSCVAALIALPEGEGTEALVTSESEGTETILTPLGEAAETPVMPEDGEEEAAKNNTAVSDAGDEAGFEMTGEGSADEALVMTADDNTVAVSAAAIAMAETALESAVTENQSDKKDDSESFTEIDNPEIEVVEENVRYEYAVGSEKTEEIEKDNPDDPAKSQETGAQTTEQEKGKVTDKESAAGSKRTDTAPKARFVPDGMVLPEDDDDTDLTPHMKLPTIRSLLPGASGDEKLKVGKGAIRSFDQISAKDDFDLPLKPGDDFDL